MKNQILKTLLTIGFLSFSNQGTAKTVNHDSGGFSLLDTVMGLFMPSFEKPKFSIYYPKEPEKYYFNEVWYQDYTAYTNALTQAEINVKPNQYYLDGEWISCYSLYDWKLKQLLKNPNYKGAKPVFHKPTISDDDLFIKALERHNQNTK